MGWLASAVGVLGRSLCSWVSLGRVWGEECECRGHMAWVVRPLEKPKPAWERRSRASEWELEVLSSHPRPASRAASLSGTSSASLPLRPFWGGGELEGTGCSRAKRYWGPCASS